MRRTLPVTRRAGAVLVATLVVLMVASVVLGAMLRTGRHEHLLLRDQQLRAQVVELAEAGLERAAAQLWADGNYESEVWRIDREELPSRGPATVTIEVRPVADNPRRRRIQVEVNYSTREETRARHRHEALIDARPDSSEL